MLNQQNQILQQAIKSKKKKLAHNPNEVTKFLKNFEENTALKFSTHIWDKTDFLLSFTDFINKLNEEKRFIGFRNYSIIIDSYTTC